jgi:hypothetical protein
MDPSQPETPAKRSDTFREQLLPRLRLYPALVQLSKADLPGRTQEKLDELMSYSTAIPVTQRVWDGMLTRADKQRLDVIDFEQSVEKFRYGHLMLLCARPIWIYRALAEIAYHVGGQSLAEYRALRGVLDPVDPVLHWLDANPVEVGDDWDADTEELEAVRAKRLVLVSTDSKKRLYWEHVQVDVEWAKFSKLWEFLARLITGASLGAPVVRWDMFDGADGKSLTRWKSRLRDKLPSDLFRLISATGSEGEYRLRAIDRSEIQVISEPTPPLPNTLQARAK